MSRYEHSADMGWKADCEGGVAELIFGYGVRMEDLPNDMPPEMRRKIKLLIEIEPVLEEVRKYFEKAVNDYNYGDSNG